MRSKFVAFAFLITSFYIYMNREEYDQNFINWDASGYYLYLPATFTYHDLNKLAFYPKINRTYIFNPSDYYGIYDQPNGNKIDKYAIGTSIFQMPFFFAAQLYCAIDHEYPNDGYSRPFERAHAIGGFIWVFVGLLFLRAFLRRHFSDNVTALTLICIAFGTNLYTYTIFTPGFSHPYSFVTFSWIIYYTDKWYDTQKAKYICWLGLALGMALITRPVNIIAVLMCLLWMVKDLTSLKERFRLLFAQKTKIAVAILLFFSVAMIQMAYWKYITGNWIYYSYEGEFFNFADPHIIDGLFSWQKGWFLYTPVAFVGMCGFFFLWRQDKKLFLAPLLFFIPFIYVIFSWHQWYYGGGFSCRPLIDALPVIAIPLAAFITGLSAVRNKAVKITASVIITALIVLNMFQSYQYALGTLPGNGMDKEVYLKIFGKARLEPKQ